MWHFLFDSIWGWIGVAGIIVIASAVVGYFVPSLRLAALAVAGAAITVAGAYTKGSRDRAALEKRRKDEAVAKARKDYDNIDARKDTPADVSDRLKRGNF